jgi:hypothetical protein
MCTSRGHFGVARGVADVATVVAKGVVDDVAKGVVDDVAKGVVVARGVVVSTEIVVSLKQLGHVVFNASRNAARNEGHIKY